MADYGFIPIQKKLIPYRFDMTLVGLQHPVASGRTFTFAVNYNAVHDFFTLDLYRDDTLIVTGEKIVYGRLLFVNQRHLDVPRVPIIPYDLSLQETRVTWDNLGVTVFLWIPGEGVVNADGKSDDTANIREGNPHG